MVAGEEMGSSSVRSMISTGRLDGGVLLMRDCGVRNTSPSRDPTGVEQVVDDAAV